MAAINDCLRLSFLRFQTASRSTRECFSICALVLIGVLRHHDNDHQQSKLRQQEIWIEWLAWAIINLAQFTIYSLSRGLCKEVTSQQRQHSIVTPTIWLTCAVAVLSQLISSQHRLTWILPLTTVAASMLAPLARRSSSDEERIGEKVPGAGAESNGPNGIIEQQNMTLTWGISILCCLVLFDSQKWSTTRSEAVASIVYLASRSAMIYLLLKLQQPPTSEQSDLTRPEAGTTECLGSLALPMLAVWTFAILIYRPCIEVTAVAALAEALLRATWWLALFELLASLLPNTVANADTISLFLKVALSGSNRVSLVEAVFGVLLSAIQSVFVLRPIVNARWLTFGLVLITVFFLLLDHSRHHRVPHAISNGHYTRNHPIESLITEHRAYFDTLVARQSQTLEGAVREYQVRYRRDPPQGFGHWFELAQEHDFVLVDEFDTFMQSIEPFYGVHPDLLRRRLEMVLHMATERFGRIDIQDGVVNITESLFVVKTALPDEDWLAKIPYNMTVLLNSFDEPMVSVPWQEIARSLSGDVDKGSNQTNVMPMLDTGRQSGWAATSPACPWGSPSRQADCPEVAEPITFVSNVTFSNDVCQNCNIKSQHGMLLQPESMRVAHELVPIMSASKPSHFHDILYPSCFYDSTREDESSKHKPWEEKDNKFYWVGTATGGWVTQENWNHMQRQRLVMKVSAHNTEPIHVLEDVGENTWVTRTTTIDEVTQYFNCRISRVVQCEESACDTEKATFRIAEEAQTDAPDAAYSHKFLLDIDGNGFSGRYYRLLKSNSVVVKQTILKEWHDDRLVPWVHYVPLSTGYEELPEMARFLAGTERGLELAHRIGIESTEWHDRALRPIDLKIAMLRMLLEYGRMMSRNLE